MHIRTHQPFSVLADEPNPTQVQRLRIRRLPTRRRPGIKRGVRRQVSVIWSRPRLDLAFRHTRWERKAVPAPVAHRVASDGLQAGAICVEGEIAIPQGNLAVEAGPGDIVSSHQGMPINGRLGVGWSVQSAREKSD